MRNLLIGAVAAAALAVGGGAVAWRIGASQAQARLDAALSSMAEAGLRVGYARSAVSGFPLRWRLRMEEVVAASPAGAWRLSLPWVEAETALFALDRTLFRTSDTASLALGPRPELGFGPVPVTATLFADALRVETRFDGGRTGLRVAATALSGDLAGPGGAVGARIALAGVDGAAEAADDGLTRLRVAADGLRIAAGPADLELAAPVFEGEGSGFGAGSPGAFVAAGGVARGALAWEALRLSGARMGVAGSVVPAAAETGPAAISGALADGRAAYGLALDDADASLGAPIDGRATAARIEARFEMPATTAPLPQPYALDLTLDGVDFDPALWAALDREGRAARGPMAARLRLGGLARMLRGLDAFTAPGGPPVAISTVEIEDAGVEGLGGAAQAAGGVALDGPLGAPEGALSVSATNWRALVEGLEALGLLDPAQAMAVTAFAEAVIGETAGADAEPRDIAAEIAFGGGAVTANGRRIR